MVECDRCQNLMPAAALRQAISDDDEFECSSCGRAFRRRVRVAEIYRMSACVLARPKPEVSVPDVGFALRELDRADNVFKRQNQTWVIKFAGEMTFMQDGRGLLYIARLLAEPKRDIPAVSLVMAASDIDPRIAAGSSGPMLDDRARDEYKSRYIELQEELAEARTNNDLGRIPQLQTELHAIGAELARATGLGGRKRERTDAERMKRAASMAVSRAMKSVEAAHTALGRHLQASIAPGVTFRYDPERETLWLT
jgi:hypothetical protein